MSSDKRPIERRLSAILAADIAGYSALMGADEETTVSDLKGHQSVVLPMVGDFGGRVVDTAGDGILAEFPSVLNAVRCAVEIQQTMAERNAGVEAARQMRFRIGINLGDVVFDQNRIYGDGVNVAARLEALSPAGGICVSRSVREAIGNKLAVGFADLGEKQVKNIAKPVHVFEVSLAGALPPASATLHRVWGFSSLRAAPLPILALAAVVAGAACAAAVLGGIHLAGSKAAQPIALPVPKPVVVTETKTVEAVPQPSTPQQPPAVAQPQIAVPAQREPAASPPSQTKPPQPPSQTPIQEAKETPLPSPATSSPPVDKPAPAPDGGTRFDGEWVVTWAGNAHCPNKSGSHNLTISGGSILESRPDPGRVDAFGAFFYVIPGAANQNVIVEHRGKLAPDGGRGEYKAKGGACAGVTQITRAPSGPQAALPAVSPGEIEAKGAGRFEGTWHVVLTGGPKCPVRSNTWVLVVANGVILTSRPTPGRVEPDGSFVFTTLSRVNPNNIVRYRGRFSGDSGRGGYIGSGGCEGTIELRRGGG